MLRLLSVEHKKYEEIFRALWWVRPYPHLGTRGGRKLFFPLFYSVLTKIGTSRVLRSGGIQTASIRVNETRPDETNIDFLSENRFFIFSSLNARIFFFIKFIHFYKSSLISIR